MSKESFSIALIDADLLCNKKQRFPNLALMKLSSYWKLKNSRNAVTLITEYSELFYDLNTWLEYQKYTEDGLKSLKKKSLFTVKKDFSHDYINTKNIKFDKIIISKVFTFSKFDENFLNILDESGNNIVEYEGTGFYYDKAPALDECIEHCFPDYHLYDSWVQKMLNTGSTVFVPFHIMENQSMKNFGFLI